MNEIVVLVIAFVLGIALGIFFFGGLWFTVKATFNSKIPALWLFTSLTVRLCVTLLGFYYIGAGSWQRLIACVLGFVAARFIVLHYTKIIETKKSNKEANHEA
jgi:F1F0 ATPase subunit 2